MLVWLRGQNLTAVELDFGYSAAPSQTRDLNPTDATSASAAPESPKSCTTARSPKLGLVQVDDFIEMKDQIMISQEDGSIGSYINKIIVGVCEENRTDPDVVGRQGGLQAN